MSGADGAERVVAAVRARVQDALAAFEGTPLVLAVSGGRDSVVLLDAVLACARSGVTGVATFDHATGEAARAAADHVAQLARAAGLRLWAARAPADTAQTELAWRRARWAFFHRVAHELGDGGRPAVIATGHTADDQVETVLLRVLRGAGARGLAGMAAPTPGVVRPLLDVRRADVAAYADARGLRWVDDPGNASPAHLRNRLRRFVLPAAVGARPGFAAALLATSRDAAAWRADVDAVAARIVADAPSADEALVVPLARVTVYDADALAVLWPALAARVGVVLDRRATARLAAFTARCARAQARGAVARGEVPVAGHAFVAVERLHATSPERAMVLRRRRAQRSDEGRAAIALDPAALARGVTLGPWRLTSGGAGDPGDPWRVRLPLGPCYVARAWRPGDRMPYRPDGAARRVKRFLSDRHVPAAERAGWPVVVAEPAGLVVWIPGVRRSPAAPARPGEPGLDLICERLPDRPE